MGLPDYMTLFIDEQHQHLVGLPKLIEFGRFVCWLAAVIFVLVVRTN